jgi:hypothetical protein
MDKLACDESSHSNEKELGWFECRGPGQVTAQS